MRIGVINTGGTISCAGTPLTPMTAQEFANACRRLINPVLASMYPDLEMTYVTDLAFPESKNGTLDSTNLQPTDWCILADYVLKNYVSFDGWIVLHGTDSMDFTGTALPFLLSAFDARGVATAALSKPVVITGSQMPMFYQAPGSSEVSSLIFNTDAYQNFCGAVAAAQSGIPEVGVYFQNHLYRGNRVVKTNASEFNAFSSPNYPALAEYGVQLTVSAENVLPPPVSHDVSLDSPEVLSRVRAQLAYISANIDQFPVMQFSAFPAQYSAQKSTALLANLITACVQQGIKGLVLESYGEGNFPSGNPDQAAEGATYRALDAANRAGVVIADCTQVLSGTVNNSAYLAGAWLPQVGALSPADMTPMSAFAKLMILMSAAGFQKWTNPDVKRLFQMSLLGEMIDVSRLDSRGQEVLLAGQSLSTLDGSAQLVNDPAQGPLLKTSKGAVLWRARASFPSTELPGRFVMQNDGNLVFYGRNNAPLWASDTGVNNGSSSQLVLSGSTGEQSVELQIYSYSRRTVTKVLFPS
jgi:L-asparaginase